MVLETPAKEVHSRCLSLEGERGCKAVFLKMEWSITNAAIWLATLLASYLFRIFLLGTLSKPRRWRQRRHGKTKDLIGRTIAQHVRFKTLYISRPSYAKQPREITTICVVCQPKFLFPFGTQRFFYTLCWSWAVAPHETVNTYSHFWDSNQRQKFIF